MKRKLKAVPAPNAAPASDVTPAAEQAASAQSGQTQVLVFVFTPQESETVFGALGELPAKVSESIRVKLKAQAEQQAALLKGLFAEPGVQAVINS